jgi:hypothetical protein
MYLTPSHPPAPSHRPIALKVCNYADVCNRVQRLQERVLEMLQQLDSGLDAVHTIQTELAAAKGYVKKHPIFNRYRQKLAENMDDDMPQGRGFSSDKSSRRPTT